MTCQVANVLKRDGVKKGDRVAIYMPVSPMLVASMLACARIGAIHRYSIIILVICILKYRVSSINTYTVNRKIFSIKLLLREASRCVINTYSIAYYNKDNPI